MAYMWFGPTQEAVIGRWTEGDNGKWAYDPRGYPDGDPPDTTALPVIYPAVHDATPPAPDWVDVPEREDGWCEDRDPQHLTDRDGTE